MIDSGTDNGSHLVKRKQAHDQGIDKTDSTLPLDAMEIDPDSCDFEPLTKSINGAALTDLSIHEELFTPGYHTDDDSSAPLEIIDTKMIPVGEVSDYDDFSDVSSYYRDNLGFWRHKILLLISILPLSSRQLHRINEMMNTFSHHFYTTASPNEKKRKGFSRMNIPKELSEASAVFICITLVMILLFAFMGSHLISNIVSVGPERNIAVVSQSFFYKHNKISRQGVGLAPPIGTSLPAKFSVFADVDDFPLNYLDTPLYFHIPRSAGTSMKGIFSSCLGKVLATEAGGLDDHRLDERIQTVRKQNGIYVNVDLYTVEGIRKAKTLGLVQSNLAEVMFSPFIFETAELFDSNHRGRLFTVLRHPVERVISLYYFLRLYDAKVRDHSMEDFMRTSGNNWMVRTLTNTVEGPIDESHLNMAKEFLRRKFLIGLLDNKTESFRRFEEYFGLEAPSHLSEQCKNDIFYMNWHVKNPHPLPEPNDPVMSMIQNIQRYDIALYEYGVQLFAEQGVMFAVSTDKA